MTIRSLDTLRQNDRAADQLQNNVQKWTQQFVGIPLIDGLLLSGKALTTANQDFAHGLGRSWRGYIVVKQDAAVTVYAPGGEDTTRFIRLRTGSGTATVSLWVF